MEEKKNWPGRSTIIPIIVIQKCNWKSDRQLTYRSGFLQYSVLIIHSWTSSSMGIVLGVKAEPVQGRTSDVISTDSIITQGPVKQQKPMVFSCLRDAGDSMTRINCLFLPMPDSWQLPAEHPLRASISWRDAACPRAIYFWVHPGRPTSVQERTILLGARGAIPWASELCEISISFNCLCQFCFLSLPTSVHPYSAAQWISCPQINDSDPISQETWIALWANTCIFAVAAGTSSFPYFPEGSSDLSNIHCRISKYSRI